MTHKYPHIDIVELAHKHLNRHPNDKSFRYLAIMRRTFGAWATTQALKQAIRDYSMIFPKMGVLLEAHEEGWRPEHGNINLDKIMIAEPHYQNDQERSWLDHQKKHQGPFHTKPKKRTPWGEPGPLF